MRHVRFNRASEFPNGCLLKWKYANFEKAYTYVIHYRCNLKEEKIKIIKLQDYRQPKVCQILSNPARYYSALGNNFSVVCTCHRQRQPVSTLLRTISVNQSSTSTGFRVRRRQWFCGKLDGGYNYDSISIRLRFACDLTALRPHDHYVTTAVCVCV